MKKLLHLFTLCLLVLTFSGCAKNGFTEFYHPIYTQEEIQESSSYVETCTEATVRSIPTGESMKTTQFNMFEKGYVIIGYSLFSSTNTHGEKEARVQGKKVGACIILIGKEYKNTENTTIAMPSYTPGSTSTTTHYGTVNSGGSYGNYQGSSTTQTYGTSSTQYVPVSMNRFSYIGSFFIKIKNNPQSLRILTNEAPASYMQLTDSRNGILIDAVMINGAAYKANIFAGDIIVSINGKECDNNSDLTKLLKNGSNNEIIIYRNGETITKNIKTPLNF